MFTRDLLKNLASTFTAWSAFGPLCYSSSMQMSNIFKSPRNLLRASSTTSSIYNGSLKPLSRRYLHSTTPTSSQSSGAAAKPQFATINSTEANDLLARQRLARPVAPAITIYRWPVAMVCGALHRNTAVLLSGTFYVFGFSYFALPFLGLPFGSADLVAWFGSLPVVAKLGIKWLYGFAFSFHCAHGLKHLIWDTAAMLTNRQVAATGWLAIGIGVLGGVGLCFW